MAEEILKCLIETGLLNNDFSKNIIDESFYFHLEDLPESRFEVSWLYQKTNTYPEVSTGKVGITKLRSFNKLGETKFVYFLEHVDDPEEIAAWIIEMLLTRKRYSVSLGSVGKITKARMKKLKIDNHLVIIEGEFYDRYQDRYRVIFYNRPKKQPLRFYIYGGKTIKYYVMEGSILKRIDKIEVYIRDNP